MKHHFRLIAYDDANNSLKYRLVDETEYVYRDNIPIRDGNKILSMAFENTLKEVKAHDFNNKLKDTIGEQNG